MLGGTAVVTGSEVEVTTISTPLVVVEIRAAMSAPATGGDGFSPTALPAEETAA